jgi:hypothetical protein
MLGTPADLEQEIVSRLSWTAIKALARASKAGRDAARRRVASLEWGRGHGRTPLPVTDLRQAFPSARRLVLRALGGAASDVQAFLAANSALLAQLQHLRVDSGVTQAMVPLLGTIAAQCPRLQCLDVQYLAFPQLQPLAGLSHLTRLKLDLGHQLRYSALTSAISGIASLRELRVCAFDSSSSSELCGTTALQRLSRLEIIGADFYPRQDLGCLAAVTSLRCLRFTCCLFIDEPVSLSRLTMLEELGIDAVPFQLPLSALAALTRLRSLDLDSSGIPQDLDQQALQQLRPVLAGLGRLSLGRIRGVGDPQLLGCIGCTLLQFAGFEGCAEPAAGAGPPLPSVSSLLLLTSRAPQLDPLVLRQAGLTSLGLLHSSDATCEQLSSAFPQLRVLQLSALSPSSELSAACLAHLGALQHLQQLCLVYPQLKPAQLQQLSAISSLRRLLIQVEDPCNNEAPLSQQPASALEAALAGLVGAARRLRQVLLLVMEWGSQGRREALQAACDRVVAGSGRQDLAVEVERWELDEAWEWMLGQAAA